MLSSDCAETDGGVLREYDAAWCDVSSALESDKFGVRDDRDSGQSTFVDDGSRVSYQPHDITSTALRAVTQELGQLRVEMQSLQCDIRHMTQREVKDGSQETMLQLQNCLRRIAENNTGTWKSRDDADDSASRARAVYGDMKQQAAATGLQAVSIAAQEEVQRQQEARLGLKIEGEWTPLKCEGGPPREYLFFDRDSEQSGPACKDSLMVSLGGAPPTAVLLDSGGSRCLCPAGVLPKELLLQPSHVRLLACNRSPLSVAGSVEIEVEFLYCRKQVRKNINFLISPDIDIPVLGSPFIMSNITSWNMIEGFVLIDGVKLSTVSRSSDTQHVVRSVVPVSTNPTALAVITEETFPVGDTLRDEQYHDPDFGALYEILLKKEKISSSVVRNATAGAMRGYAKQAEQLGPEG